jgi:hypothetical protein
MNLHPEARFSYSLTYHTDYQEAILFGGFAPGMKFDDTWSWNGDEWNLLNGDGPVARDSAAITYDTKRKCVYLFGGHTYDDRFENDTWQWKDNQWTRLELEGPPARNHSSMIYFPDIDRTILFGGRSKKEDLGDTWTWDGKSWEQLLVKGPSPRDGYRFVYNNIDKKITLFGGRARAGSIHSRLGDTWEFDGINWTQVSDTGPEPRSHHGMFFDQPSSKIFLFGGESSFSSYFNDFWSWDGTQWERLDTPTPPSRSRIFISHQANGQAIAFGGKSDSGALRDTWVWLSKSQLWKKKSFQTDVNREMNIQEVRL